MRSWSDEPGETWPESANGTQASARIVDRTAARTKLRSAVRAAARSGAGPGASGDREVTPPALLDSVAPAMREFVHTLRRLGAPGMEVYAEVRAVMDDCPVVDHATVERRRLLAEARREIERAYGLDA